MTGDVEDVLDREGHAREGPSGRALQRHVVFAAKGPDGVLKRQVTGGLGTRFKHARLPLLRPPELGRLAPERHVAALETHQRLRQFGDRRFAVDIVDHH